MKALTELSGWRGHTWAADGSSLSWRAQSLQTPRFRLCVPVNVSFLSFGAQQLREEKQTFPDFQPDFFGTYQRGKDQVKLNLNH